MKKALKIKGWFPKVWYNGYMVSFSDDPLFDSHMSGGAEENPEMQYDDADFHQEDNFAGVSGPPPMKWTRDRILLLLACLLCWWPLPVGLGYLFLKKWRKFLFAVVALQIVLLTLVRVSLGHTAGYIVAATILVWVIVDTLREARKRWHEMAE